MATLQVRNKSYRILFCFGGRRHAFTLGTVGKKEAELVAANVDRILLRVEQNLLTIPPGVDVVAFVQNGGRVPETELVTPAVVTFGSLRDKYLASHANGAMEDSSISALRLHLKHIGETLGERFALRDLAFSDVQGTSTGGAG